MRILVVTGIYPPEVGGPAYYAQGLVAGLQALGHAAAPVSMGALRRFPTGVRHALFFFRLVPHMLSADRVIALDTFSVALPAAVASSMFRVPFVIRTGGDFVWEQYVARTGEPIVLKDFYTSPRRFTRKEKITLRATRYALARAAFVVFSTRMQRDIWTPYYAITPSRARIIENAIEEPLAACKPEKKNFLWYVRDTAFKNGPRLHAAFARAKKAYPDIVLEEGQLPKAALLEKMAGCWAVVLPSLTEISPNYILDALRFHKPFIMDKYSGLAEQLAPYGTLVDPLSEDDIARAIETLASEKGYQEAKEKAAAFSQVRGYDALAREFAALLETARA